MRPTALFLIAFLVTPGLSAQEAAPPAPPAEAPAAAAVAQEPADLPVSLERIRKALAREPLFPVQSLRDQPTFRVEVQERNRLQDLVASLDFSSGPTPAGGVYAAEMQRVMFPSVSNPLRQPLAAFNQTELLTVLLQTIAGTYLAGRVAGAITNADRAAAEADARAELKRTIGLYCAAQPNAGAGIAICETPPP